jgi:hypothetical protein
MAKCPACDWEIKDDGIPVTKDGKTVVACCHECADAIRKGTAPSK